MDGNYIFGLAQTEDSTGLEKQTVLVFPHRPTQFDNHHLSFIHFSRFFYPSNNFIGHVRNRLDILTFIAKSSLPINNRFIDLSGGHIVFPP